MKKENEELIYEIIKRDIESTTGPSEWLFEVVEEHKLAITRKFLWRTITRKYSGEELLKLVKKCDRLQPTLFSVLINEFSFKSNPETDEEREARLGF